MAEQISAYDVRARLEDMLERDLLGPWDGATEELPAGTTPGERYLLGRLVPRRTEAEEPPAEPTAATGDAAEVEGAEDDGVEDRPELVDQAGLDADPTDTEEPPSAAAVRGRAMAAASLGLACAVSGDVDMLLVTASWGRYDRGPSELQRTEADRPRLVWHRVPVEGTVEVPVHVEGTGCGVPYGEQEGVLVRWRVRHRDGRRLLKCSWSTSSRFGRTPRTGNGCSRRA